MNPHPNSLDADAMFGLLSNERRRRLLKELDRRGTATLDEMARVVAAAEQGTSTEEVETNARKSVHVSLYQTHVPRLAEAGVVDYDSDAKTVSLVRCTTTRRLIGMLDDRETGPTGGSCVAAALLGVCLASLIVVTGGGETAWRLVAGLLGTTVAGLAVGMEWTTRPGGDRWTAGERRLPWQ